MRMLIEDKNKEVITSDDELNAQSVSNFKKDIRVCPKMAFLIANQ